MLTYADGSNSGKVDYASFIEYFRGVPDVVKTDRYSLYLLY
jgi:hypothetical protein